MKLNYKVYGKGDPVIILHGLFGTLDNWRTIAGKLENNFTLFLIDQRNHGRSPHDPNMSIQYMADDLYHFMDDHSILSAHIVGHSMGGKTAMQFAINHPEKVNKLAVIDIAPKKYPAGHDEIFKALFAVDLEKIQSRSEAEEAMRPHIYREDVLLFLMKNLTRNEAGGFEWKMNLPVLYQNYASLIDQIEHDQPHLGDTLFIRGEKSDYILDQDFHNIRDIFPRSKVVTIPQAGHWVHAEQADLLVKELQNFFDNFIP